MGTTAVGETGIRTATEEGVRTIWFTRPNHRNAMTLEMFRAYYGELLDADRDPAVRAIVVTGEGDWFCSGADPAALAAMLDPANRRILIEELGYPPHTPLSLRKPLIAAVNGGAGGLGLVQALYADVRFMADEAKLSTAFSKLGLIAEYGSAWLLPRLVGVPVALDLLLSSRKVDAAEALRIGLVHRVSPRAEVLNQATEYALALVSNCSPSAMAVIKRQVWAGLESGAEQAIAESVQLMGDSLGGPDLAEALRAGAEGRAPDFAPLGRTGDES
jgi:enoyl-CoA hydratase/carnithine racemase